MEIDNMQMMECDDNPETILTLVHLHHQQKIGTWKFYHDVFYSKSKLDIHILKIRSFLRVLLVLTQRFQKSESCTTNFETKHKHLKKSNAACFYTPIVLKLAIIVQMW